ncbi:hypothetical protein ABIE45_006388 [Methylobacterium sp. OAE515]|uniref:hypothetical protein n=1 Tax=Methylobacterium sp. OAE515 TaxID=2817895 RepID=UPI001A0CE9D8
MPISPRQLTASLLAADHIADRHLIAAFVDQAATQPAPNPFPETSVGTVSQVWRQRAVEFQSFAVEVAGLTCLLATLSDLSLDEPLMQEILRAGPHTVNVFHRGDGCRIVGAVLYGKPGVALPVLPILRAKASGSAPRSRGRVVPGQLELFTQTGT